MAETIAIIDYGSGNLRSVAKAFERAAADADLTASVLVTSDPRAVAAADRIVLPGVGAFRACAEGLAAVDGMTEAISEVVMAAQRPFMGVCVGMQLMADEGLEFGATPGLGWIPGKVRALADDRPDARTPHMGWNELIGARAPM
ncbi:MAG: imidazole glycerol phosphate synthase subunit HisH, partial [Pseudomonadota bacterium]